MFDLPWTNTIDPNALFAVSDSLHGPNSAKITATQDLVNNITTCSSALA